MKILSKYIVTREYGGPEEGGWYYDWYEHVEVVGTYDAVVARCEAVRLNAEEKTLKKANRERDRFSVIGTPDIMYLTEDVAGSRVRTERPHYE